MVFGPMHPVPVAYAAAHVAVDNSPAYVPAHVPTAAQTEWKPEVEANPLPAGTSSLRIGTKFLVIVAGLRLLAHQIPGLSLNSPEGLVARAIRTTRHCLG